MQHSMFSTHFFYHQNFTQRRVKFFLTFSITKNRPRNKGSETSSKWGQIYEQKSEQNFHSRIEGLIYCFFAPTI